MKIVVASADINADLFEAYHHCMEKYWPDHPEIIYLTETIENPYYRTICKNISFDTWTKRIRESLEEIDDKIILFTTDDDFLNDYVNTAKLNAVLPILTGNVANVSLELSFDEKDVPCLYEGIKFRPVGIPVRVMLQCGLWQKDKLIKILERDCLPWIIEEEPDDMGYDYFVLNNSKILSWVGDGFSQRGALVVGKWHRYAKSFLDKEGIKMDYSTRGFCD